MTREKKRYQCFHGDPISRHAFKASDCSPTSRTQGYSNERSNALRVDRNQDILLRNPTLGY